MNFGNILVVKNRRWGGVQFESSQGESGEGVVAVNDLSSKIHKENTRGVIEDVSFTGGSELLVGC
jgi:hypothetical protein